MADLTTATSSCATEARLATTVSRMRGLLSTRRSRTPPDCFLDSWHRVDGVVRAGPARLNPPPPPKQPDAPDLLERG